MRLGSEKATVLIPALIAASLGATTVPLATSLIHLVRQLQAFGAMWWSIPSIFAIHSAGAWLLGGVVPAVFVVWAIAKGTGNRLVRVAFGVWGLGQVAMLGLVLFGWDQARRDLFPAHAEFPTIDVVLYLIAGLGCVVVSAGAVRGGSKLPTALGAALASMMVLGVHHRSVARSVEDQFQQDLPGFKLRFVAARYLADASQAPRDAEIPCPPQRCILDRDDSLELDAHNDVQRIRLEFEGAAPILVVVLRGEAADRFRDWAVRREGELDALFVDGTLEMVPRWTAVPLDGSFALTSSEDPAQIERLYRRLVRAR